MSEHRHQTPLRGVKVVPRPKPDNPAYTALNYAYAGKTGRVHEAATIGGRQLVKVGFDDRKIVYYLLEDLELDESSGRETFHDRPLD
jgi:hypothetical protein